MLLPDEITQQTTDALEQLPRSLNRRSFSTGRRHHILQQKQTDALPPLTFDTPNAKVAWRQVTQLRAENRHLRSSLEERQAEIQQLVYEYTNLKAECDREISIIHNGHQQENEHYQGHLQEVMAERSRLQAMLIQLEQSFQDTVEDEARKLMTDAAMAVIQEPSKSSVLLQDVVKTVEMQLRQEENKQLVEMFYLKRELQRVVALLEQERQQLATEQQQLLVLRYSASEQASLRQRTLTTRLHLRWRTVSLLTSLGVLTLFIVLQFLFFALFHVPLVLTLTLSVIAPVVVCALLALVLSTPLGLLKYLYESVPHRKKA